MNYITPLDVAHRLMRKKYLWYHGEPTISLRGCGGNFSELTFDFSDERVTMHVYTKDKEAQEYILGMAELAVLNFASLRDEIMAIHG